MIAFGSPSYNTLRSLNLVKDIGSSTKLIFAHTLVYFHVFWILIFGTSIRHITIISLLIER